MSRAYDFAHQQHYTEKSFIRSAQPVPTRPLPAERRTHFVPVFLDDVAEVVERTFLSDRIRRLGPMGLGHYACESEEHARAVGLKLLEPAAKDEQDIAVVRLEMPATSAIWEALQLPDQARETVAKGLPSIRMSFPTKVGNVPLYFYNAERIGYGAEVVARKSP